MNMRKAFKVIDADNDNKIGINDLEKFLGQEVKPWEVLNMMQKTDENSDGSLECDEFFTIMNKILIFSEL